MRNKKKCTHRWKSRYRRNRKNNAIHQNKNANKQWKRLNALSEKACRDMALYWKKKEEEWRSVHIYIKKKARRREVWFWRVYRLPWDFCCVIYFIRFARDESDIFCVSILSIPLSFQVDSRKIIRSKLPNQCRIAKTKGKNVEVELAALYMWRNKNGKKSSAWEEKLP